MQSRADPLMKGKIYVNFDVLAVSDWFKMTDPLQEILLAQTFLSCWKSSDNFDLVSKHMISNSHSDSNSNITINLKTE